MDLSFNDFDNWEEEIVPIFDEEIRPPDETKREQLTEDVRSEFDIELEKVLYLTMQEVRDEEIKNHKFEEEIINNYAEQQRKRRELFRDLLVNMSKLSKFDKDIKDLYEFIDPIIEAYCLDFIQFYEIDQETHKKVFQVLGTIRVNKNILDTLTKILIKNP
jgi:hypothetical protein